jgi:hypothetical protein
MLRQAQHDGIGGRRDDCDPRGGKPLDGVCVEVENLSYFAGGSDGIATPC